MCFGGGSGDTEREIQQQQAQRQQAIQQGMVNIDNVFSQYNPGYYQGIRQNTLAQLQPQFSQQYNKAGNNLTFGLADKGLLKSSAGREAATDLEVQRGIGQMGVINQAEEQVRNVQQQVAGQRANVVNQLVSSQDPTLAAQQAVAGTAGISAPSIIAPLGNVFQNLANQWQATAIGNMYSPADQQKKWLGMARAPGGTNRIV